MAKKPAQVFHFDLYGKREDKYDFLNEKSMQTIAWEELAPREPMLFFVPKDYETQKEYNKGFSLTELFPLNSVGIVTARDGFTIHDTKEEVKNTIEEFLSLEDEDARARFNLGKDVRDWQVNFAKKDLSESYPNKGRFAKVNYRPFDTRWTFYTGKSKGFHCYPRNDVMQHFTKNKNLGLSLCKQFKSGDTYQHILISNDIIESSFVSNKTSEITSLFPLYLYPDENQLELGESVERVPNLNMEIVEKIAQGLKLEFEAEKSGASTSLSGQNKFAPIDLLDYIYAVLHSPTYREKYKEFLKIDFPRVPYPKNSETFWKLVQLGGEIRQIHLLESQIVEDYITTYPKAGSNKITRKLTLRSPGFVTTEDGLGQVWINDEQYFDQVPEVAWNFYIGGYQPAQKWLKDRVGRTLDFEDILHYQKIIVALSETDRLMKEIDKIEV